jgi:hypothetical protein
MSKAIVLAVNTYSFTDSQDASRVVSGTKVTYFDAIPASGKTRGVNVVTVTGDVSTDTLFTVVPGIYDLDLGVQMSKGKPVMKLNSAKYLSPYDVNKVISA